MPELHHRRITVAGLGRFGGGIEVSRWLAREGAKVLVTDKEPAEKLRDSIDKLRGLPIEFRLGGHRAEDFTKTDLVVTSPAIPPTSEFLQAARDAGVPVTTEIRLFIERCRCPILGVTGTKGKSTTTAMLGAILRTRFPAWVGGNIGGSLLDRLPQIEPEHVVVLELSSYMLEHLRPMRWSPHIAVVTMVGKDHLEWHGSLENYVDAKRDIVRFQSAADFAVLNENDATARTFAEVTKADVVTFGSNDSEPFRLSLIGKHNQLNAQAAFAAARSMGLDRESASEALRGFKGLPHRLQVVHVRDGVTFVNDSIATLPEAAIAACEAFAQGTVVQIVGGYDKHLDMSGMCEHLARRCKAVLTIGALGSSLAAEMRGSLQRRAEVHECGGLTNAMAAARRLVSRGDVILLSPGCASYDQFVNFEARGDEFTSLARAAES